MSMSGENAGGAPALSEADRAKLLTAYKRMLSYQFFGALALIVLLAAGLLLSYSIAELDPPILVLVTLSGMLGAFFSALTRLYNVDQLSMALISPTVSDLEGRYLVMYSLVPPMIGAIASVVLYMVFVGGIVGGGVFPEMVCKSDAEKCSSLIEVMKEFGPKAAPDYGKVLVWAFIAGFSERFVPDLLQSLVAKTQKKDEE